MIDSNLAMHFAPRSGLWAAVLGVALLLPLSRDARAQPKPAPPSEVRREAARKFAEGTRAFDAGDFVRAGEVFAACYKLSPHPDALWNGARAWHRAGELARAANLYARYLRESSADAPDRPDALAAQKQLAGKLARIEVHTGEGVTDVRVDDVPVEGPVVFVLPGIHALRGHTPKGDVEERQTLAAGAEVSVLLTPPADAPVQAPVQVARAHSSPPSSSAPAASPPASAVTVAVAPPPERAEAPRHSGLPPAVVFVETGVTLAVVGVTVWSGLDTLSTLHTFNTNPTQGTLDSGRSQEVRTNVLIGASIGLAALTGITAVWFVDWHGRARGAALAVGPGTAILRGTF